MKLYLYIALLYFLGCSQNYTTYTRVQFIEEASLNIKRFTKEELNKTLNFRGADTIYSLFPTQEILVKNYNSAPNIRVYNTQGELIITLCNAHFPNPLSYIKKALNNTTAEISENFYTTESNYLNAKNVFSKIPQESQFIIFIPWSINDTITNEKYNLNPQKDWINELTTQFQHSSLPHVFLWESRHKLTTHSWTNAEFAEAEFKIMKELFPQIYLD
jgi:hypothetical protein